LARLRNGTITRFNKNQKLLYIEQDTLLQLCQPIIQTTLDLDILSILKKRSFYRYSEFVAEYSAENLFEQIQRVEQDSEDWRNLFWKFIKTTVKYTGAFKLNSYLIPLQSGKQYLNSSSKSIFWYSNDWNDILIGLGKSSLFWWLIVH
jgi:hypothetical protein